MAYKKKTPEFSVKAPETSKITINGIEFDILASDFEIFDRALSLREKFERMDKTDLNSVRDTVRQLLALTDEILGEGATKKILGGRPANMNFMVSNVISPLLSAVTEEFSKEYGSIIENEYE